MKAQPGIVDFVDPVNQCSYKTNFVRECGKTKIVRKESCEVSRAKSAHQ